MRFSRYVATLVSTWAGAVGSPTCAVIGSAVLLSAPAGVAGAETAAGNALEFDSPARIVEIGYYPRVFLIDFAFRVGGEGEVVIKSHTSSCSCTTTTLEQESFYAGQKGLLSAIYEFRGEVAPETQFVQVVTNQSPEPQLLRIVPRRTADGLWVERKELQWMKQQGRNALTLEAEVDPSWRKHELDAVVTAEGWKATLQPIEPAGRYRLTVEPTVENPPAASVVLQLKRASAEGAAPERAGPKVEIALSPAR